MCHIVSQPPELVCVINEHSKLVNIVLQFPLVARLPVLDNVDKTRLVEFGRWAERDRRRRGEGKPETFDFLGFTHYCGKHRKGHFCVWRKTARKRLAARLKQIKQRLQVRQHEPIPQMGKWLQRVVTGYYNYHAVPGNLASLSLFQSRLGRLWRQVLRRRGDRRKMDWNRFNRVCGRYLPPPRTLHPYPYQRFDVTHPRQEPYA